MAASPLGSNNYISLVRTPGLMTSLTRINGAPWNQSQGTFCTDSLHPSYIIITFRDPLPGAHWSGDRGAIWLSGDQAGWGDVMSPASCVRMFWLGRVLPGPAVSPSHICHLNTVYTQATQANTGARTRQGSQKTLAKSQFSIRFNQDSPGFCLSGILALVTFPWTLSS